MMLENRVAIITGGSSGLGKGITEVFSKEGAKVVVVGRNEISLKNTVSQLNNNSSYIQGDISNSTDVINIINETKKRYGTLDILVNNAGITGRRYGDGPTHLSELTALDKIIDINIKGTFMCSKYALQEFVKKEEGIIVNMSSVLGLVGCYDFFNSHVYQMTKSAIIQLTRSMATYYAKYNIRVNALAPGFVSTEATKNIKDRDTAEFVNKKQLLS